MPSNARCPASTHANAASTSPPQDPTQPDRMPLYLSDVIELWGGRDRIAQDPLEEPIVGSHVSGREALKSSVYYREWCEPQGIIDAVAIPFVRDASTLGSIAMGRHVSAGEISEAELVPLRLIAPHFRRAVSINRLLELQSLRTASFASTLNNLGTAIVFVAEQMQVAYANAATSDLLRAGDLMSVHRGTLRLIDQAASEQLAVTVALAARNEAQLRRRGIGIPVRRRDGEAAVFHVLPLGGRGRPGGEGRLGGPRGMSDEAGMPGRLPRYCVEDVDRHGNVRNYRRRAGWPKVRLPGVPWTEPFMEAYRAALDGTPEVKPRDRHATLPDTWKWLCQQYVASAKFKGLDVVTQRRRRALLEATYDEPTKPGATIVFADFPLARLTPAAIRILRDRRADVPDGANNTVKAIRATFKWATLPEVALAPHNPARDVTYIATASEGFHTWSVDEVLRYVERHPAGSRTHLALCLLLFAGGRRSDAMAFGRQHLQGGWLRYTQHKGWNSRPMTLEVPVLPVLRAAIQACPVTDLTFLVTERGRPFTSNGFGNWFKDRCREAALPPARRTGCARRGRRWPPRTARPSGSSWRCSGGGRRRWPSTTPARPSRSGSPAAPCT